VKKKSREKREVREKKPILLFCTFHAQSRKGRAREIIREKGKK